MDPASPNTAAPASPVRVADPEMGMLRVYKLEAMSEAGLIMVQTMKQHADAGHSIGIDEAWSFARLARGLRQTLAMEIQLFPGIERERTDGQLHKLRKFSRIGLEFLGQITERVHERQKIRREDATAFSNISRAVRLVIAMEDWVDHESCMPEPERLAERARRSAAERARQARAPRARGTETGWAEGSGTPAYRDECLSEPDIYAELGDRTTVEIVAAACADLGVECDLALFTDAVTEAEAQPEADVSSGAGGAAATVRPGSQDAAERGSDHTVLVAKPQASGHDPPA